uniref:Uncharacterized protein n=1 Tax=Clandestinovirus TaxID=2831644 RepID=A0A8F8KLC8_9VIRU|nr:hypothetical protein KOM_12_555 [Clandestinovirus]
MHDEIWAVITDPSKVSPFELKRNPNNRIYLGSVDKINIRYDDMLSEYKKPESEDEKNEPVTVNVVFESFKLPHYTLSVIFDTWHCTDLIIYRKPE